MDLSRTWVAAGAGGGVTAIVGASINYMQFFSPVANPPMHCVVVSSRLGLALRASAGLSIAVMMGVKDRWDVMGLKGGGWDWGLDVGAKLGEIFKTGGKAYRAAKVLQKVSKAADKNLYKVATEAAKSVVNELSGNLDAGKGGRGFFLFGTPAGVGVGAGVWYEWQKVHAVGGAYAWGQFKPKWRIIAHRGSLWLQMVGIPEPDGANVTVDFRLDEWGRDPTLKVTEKVAGISSTVIGGEAKGYMLVEHAFRRDADTPPLGGINLSKRRLLGRADARGVTTTPLANKTIKVGLDVGAHARKVWETDDYAPLWTDGSGQWSRLAGAGTKWLN